MSTPHPHAVIIKAFADDPAVKIEWFDYDVSQWKPSSIEFVVRRRRRRRSEFMYRLAPKDPQPDAKGWIEWKGGECPVPGDTVVTIRCRSGDEDTGPASNYYWLYDEDSCDIISYRIHKPEKAKRYKYLWAHKAGTVVFREEEFDGASVGAIRLEWSKTEVPE